MAHTSKYVKPGEQESPAEKAGTNQIVRIFPIDDYALPEELLSFTARHHFLRMPLLGQHNPITEADDWCGRTSASMVWNYHQRVSSGVRESQERQTVVATPLQQDRSVLEYIAAACRVHLAGTPKPPLLPDPVQVTLAAA